MAGVNKVILMGRLGNDPEIRAMDNGNSVANLSLATSETWKDKQTGEKKEKTEWHRVVFFGKPAEIIGQYSHKGDMLYVEGSLETRKWQDNDGNDKYTTEIKGREFQFVGGGSQAQSPPPANSQQSSGQQSSGAGPDDFDDLF